MENLTGYSKALSILANKFNARLDRDEQGLSFVISKPTQDQVAVGKRFSDVLKGLSNSGENITITRGKDKFHLRKVSKQQSNFGNEYIRFWAVKAQDEVSESDMDKIMGLMEGETSAETVDKSTGEITNSTIEW